MALEAKNRGNEAFSKGNFEEAVSHFTTAVELDPSSHVLYSNRSASYASLKRFQEALDDADKTIALKSDWPKGYSRRATALHGLRRYPEAEKAYLKAIELDPSNNQLKESLQEVRRLMAPPGGMDIGELFGKLFAGDIITKIRAHPKLAPFLSDPDFVTKIIDIQKNPSTINSHLSDKRIMAVISAFLGADQSDPMETEETQPSPPPKREEPKKEEPKKPAEPEVNLAPEQKQAEEFKQKGNDAYKSKKFGEAIEFYTKANEIDPTNIVYYTNRAAAYFEDGKYAECIKDCESAIEEGRKQRADYKHIAKAFTRIGNAYMKMNKYGEAVEAYQHALTEDRTPQTLELLKKAEKIKEETERKSYIDPQKSLEHKEKGNQLFKDGKFPEAVKEYTEAMKRNPDDHVLYSNRAACYTKLGEYNLALKDCDICIKMKPDFVKAYSRKGTCLFFMKDYQKALEAYDQGLKYDENNAELLEGVNKTITMMNKQSTPQDEKTRLENAARDPEVQQILSDPVMRQILEDMQSDPNALREHMKSPMVAAKIQKLINAGVIGVR